MDSVPPRRRSRTYQSAKAGPACRTVVASRRTGGSRPGRVSRGSEAVSRRRTPASPWRQASPSRSMTQGPVSLNVPNSVSGEAVVRGSLATRPAYG